MPELPDITVYCESLERLLAGRSLEGIRLLGPALLRSVEPPIQSAVGRRVLGARRLGKRVVLELEGDLFLVFHLMIAGRFKWSAPGATPARKRTHACFDFAHGTLLLTEASTKKRASLYCVAGEAGLAEHDPGGLEVLSCDRGEFARRLSDENHTLKRSLTDPRLFSGIGNAYSDEILHHARLSPIKLSQKLDPDEIARLYTSTRSVLTEWTERLRAECGSGLPEKVTAFRPEMAVHGRYGEPCPDCGDPVQRIVRASNEVNYCATCQTDGKLLADRALSALLRRDWPRTLEEMEERRSAWRPSEAIEP
jgi:formamidopyrimidine-DNA glycosylase